MNSLSTRSFIENTSKASLGAAVTLKLPAGSLLRQNGSGKDKMIVIQIGAVSFYDEVVGQFYQEIRQFRFPFFWLHLKIESF